MDFFPYPTPRTQQAEVLQALERFWEKYDIFVLTCPTASGKTALAKTIADWRGNAAVITPTNLLVEQFLDEFPETQKLFKRDWYKCPRWSGNLTCKEAEAKYGRKKMGCDVSCDYLRDNRRVRGRGSFVANYYVYMANQLFKPTLILDEGHNALKLVQELSGQKIWKHDWHYPYNIWTAGDILAWVESLAGSSFSEDKQGILEGLREELTSGSPRYILKRGYDTWKRTDPWEERELLTMLPIDVRDSPPYLWPNKVHKIVMMSATISYKDLESLGLDRRRTLYLEVDSPIPASNRPIITDYCGNVNRDNLEECTLEMANKLETEYLPRYAGSKGLIHATYAQAKIFKKFWEGNDRFLFHDRDNVRTRFSEFIASSPDSGRIFVASGLYEGIDLADDLARWQVVSKVPWPNLGDPATKYKAEQDESWFCWQAAKNVLQACGRVCRSESDRGDTIIMDGSFDRLVKLMYKYNLTPGWWKDALPERLRK